MADQPGSSNTKPLGASHEASRALTSNASCREWQSATRSSAYLTSTGSPPAPNRWCRSGLRRPAPSRPGR
jgi:hypothetical protein